MTPTPVAPDRDEWDALVVRTDYSDEQVLAAVAADRVRVVFLADGVTMRDRGHCLLAVSTLTGEQALDDAEYAGELAHGRAFRLVPKAVYTPGAGEHGLLRVLPRGVDRPGRGPALTAPRFSPVDRSRWSGLPRRPGTTTAASAPRPPGRITCSRAWPAPGRARRGDAP